MRKDVPLARADDWEVEAGGDARRGDMTQAFRLRAIMTVGMAAEPS
jgi:hypothetical protein